MMTTFPSKVLSLIAAMNWGMRDVKITSPVSFSAASKGGRFSFACSIQNHQDAWIDLPDLDHGYDFLLVLILNKKGDNLIVLKNDVELMSNKNSSVSFEWLAPRIKRKDRVEVSKIES